MNMKTSQSFFPTTTKPTKLKKDIIYKIMKKPPTPANHPQDRSSLTSSPTPTHQRSQRNSLFLSTQKKHSLNIFKSTGQKPYSIDDLNERPIGGMELFRKMEKNKEQQSYQSMIRLSKKGSKKNIGWSREKIAVGNSGVGKGSALENQKLKEVAVMKEEVFAQHDDHKQKYTKHMSSRDYISKTAGKVTRSTAGENKRCSSVYKSQFKQKSVDQTCAGKQYMSGCLSPMSQSGNRNKKSDQNWAQSQSKAYLDKMSILNQINHNKPLLQKLGNKYFQCLLRDGYKQQTQYLHKSPFIYQIKQKLSQTKFISRVKAIQPNLLERCRILVKGQGKKEREVERERLRQARQREEGDRRRTKVEGRRWEAQAIQEMDD